ncbi:MAG: hypothetical protein IJ593_05705 [Lachnospiraceae bacterium]|nr:hypothetical protein [Lachnospiraceae bacterium]
MDTKVTLYIPVNISLRNEIAKGFAMTEIVPAAIIYVFFVIAAIAEHIFLGMQIATISILLIGLVVAIGIVIKMDNNLSLLDMILDALNFNKERHIYPYRPYKEYDI